MGVSLTKADNAILDVLSDGRATPGYLVDETGLSRQGVHNRLNVLAAAGYIEKIHEGTALYELLEDPRDSD